VSRSRHSSIPTDFIAALAAEHRKAAYSVGRFRRRLPGLKFTESAAAIWAERALTFMEEYAVRIHSRGEGELLFDVLSRKRLREVDRETLRILATEHAFVDRSTSELGALARPALSSRPAPAVVRGMMDRLVPLVEFFARHLRREEDDLYPLIRTYLDQQERVRLSRRLLVTVSAEAERDPYAVAGVSLPRE
jgi:hemerythrin-like domain-containing protein